MFIHLRDIKWRLENVSIEPIDNILNTLRPIVTLFELTQPSQFIWLILTIFLEIIVCTAKRMEIKRRFIPNNNFNVFIQFSCWTTIVWLPGYQLVFDYILSRRGLSPNGHAGFLLAAKMAEGHITRFQHRKPE